jgi:threonine/homoserine/homoserine lactone efflux protein
VRAVSVGAVSLLAGALLGLSLAAPPGPMNALIAEEAVTRGWRAGVAAGLGAMAADACFFLLAVAGVTTVVDRVAGLRSALVGAGGLLMVYFAYRTLRRARGPFETADSTGTSFAAAFALAFTNPYQITWWLTAGVALLDPGRVSVAGHSLPATDGALTVAGFFVGILLWVTAFPAALRAAGERVAALGRWVAYASALLLAWFGVAFLVAAAAG